MTSIGSGKVSAVRFQESGGIREGIEETQDTLSQPLMSTQEARLVDEPARSEGRETLCKQLTGLTVRQA